jgi:hypothetical protein
VALEEAFLLEAVLVVKAMSGGVVCLHLEHRLVVAMPGDPSDAGHHESVANPASPPTRINHMEILICWHL